MDRPLPIKTYKTALVIIPPEELWVPIQKIRQKYDRQFSRWMPHITLIYPFRPQEEFRAVAKKFSRLCEPIRPFEVVLQEFNFFRHSQRSYTLWLAPEPAKPVVALQTVLGCVVPECHDVRRFKQGFTPHLSVGQVRGKVSLVRLLSDLQRDWMPLSFTVSEVSLIWRNDPPDDVFRIWGKVRLGGR